MPNTDKEHLDPTEAPYTVMSDVAHTLRENGRGDLAERMGEALGQIRGEEDDTLHLAVKGIEGLRSMVKEKESELKRAADLIDSLIDAARDSDRLDDPAMVNALNRLATFYYNELEDHAN